MSLLNEQYNEKFKDFNSTETAVFSVFGSDGNGSLDIRIKKSSYQGATNEGTSDQTRQYNRSDILKAFQKSTTKVETPAVKLAILCEKEIDLQKKIRCYPYGKFTKFELLKHLCLTPI